MASDLVNSRAKNLCTLRGLFDLKFTEKPIPLEEVESVESIMKPFPAGLLTDAGIVVANPVFAPRDVRARFTKRAYH